MKRELLASQREAFLRNLVRKTMAYALGRSLHDRDDCAIEQILRDLERDGHRARTLIRGIVLSPPFRMKGS